MQVDVVSAERRLFQGEVTEIYARSVEGEIGILPGHEPILLALAAAPLRLRRPDGQEVVVAVHRGFLECREDEVNVLADIAELVGEIDITRAERALSRAEQHVAMADYTGDARAEQERAELRIRLGRQRRSAGV